MPSAVNDLPTIVPGHLLFESAFENIHHVIPAPECEVSTSPASKPLIHLHRAYL